MKILFLLSLISLFCVRIVAQTCERTETFDNNADGTAFDERDFDYVKAYSYSSILTTQVIGGLDGNYFSGRQLIADYNGEHNMGLYFYRDVKLTKMSLQVLEGQSLVTIFAINNKSFQGQYNVDLSSDGDYQESSNGGDYITVRTDGSSVELTFSTGAFDKITDIQIEQIENDDLKLLIDKVVFTESCVDCSFATENFSSQITSGSTGSSYSKIIGCIKYDDPIRGLYFMDNNFGELLNMNPPYFFGSKNTAKISAISSVNNFKINNCKVAFRNDQNTITFEGYDNGVLVASTSGINPLIGGVYGSSDNQITYSRTSTNYGNLSFSSNWWNIDEIRIFSSGDYLEIGLDDIVFQSPIVQTTPTISTTLASSVLSNSAISGGNITSDGNSSITAKGVCWSTSVNPTIADSKTSDGSGTASFSSSITSLSPVTVYHYRAYATNSKGTSYGSDLTFTTSATTPTVTTTNVTITSQGLTYAASGGNVTSDGGAAVTERGICWSTNANPTISDSKSSDGSGTGIFSSFLSWLSTATTYHCRAYATNSAGTSYGEDKTYTTAVGSCPDLTESFDTDNGFDNDINSSIRDYLYVSLTSDSGEGNISEIFDAGGSYSGLSNQVVYLTNNTGTQYTNEQCQHKFFRNSILKLKSLKVNVVNAGSSGINLRAFGPSGKFITVAVNFNVDGVYGTGDNTITVESGASNLKNLTFGSGWFAINEFQFHFETSDPVDLYVDNLVLVDCEEGIPVGPTTFQSTTTGTWSSAGTWVSNAVPSSTDHVQVNNTHNITVNSNTTIDNLILKSGGIITVTGTAVLTVDGDLQDEGGNFAIASGAQVVVKGNVNNSSAASKLVNTSTNGISIKGNVDVGQ